MKTMPLPKEWIPFLLLLAAMLLPACSRGLPVANAQSNDVSTDRDEAGEGAQVIAEGRLLPRDSAWLTFGQPGLVAEVLVEEGQQVTKGDVLARLNGRERVAAQLAAAELERLSAQQALDDLLEKAPLAGSAAYQRRVTAEKTAMDARQALEDLDTDAFQQELDDAKLAVEEAQNDLEDAQEAFDKVKDLDEDNFDRTSAEDALEEAQQAYDDAVDARDRLVNQRETARANEAQAESDLEQARREADARQAGPDPDDTALAQSRLDNAIAQVTASQAALEDLELVAPFDGAILEVEISVNERVIPNEPVLLLADRSAWVVETSDLTEIDVVNIEPGILATITPDALPDLELSGLVEKVADTYTEKSGDVLYTVRIQLNETDPRLRWGMTMQVNFQQK